VRLETDRLVLRPLTMEDSDAFAGFYADPEVMRFIGSGVTFDPSWTRNSLRWMIERFEADGFGQLAVERRVDGQLMGRCGLLVWDTESWTPTRLSEATGPTEIEVGYLLGREYWGQGFATEAAAAVRDWAFANLELERLIALIYPQNERSIGVARRLGMEPNGEVEIFARPAVVYACGKPPAR
jgi:RimJ/RimL family protein N-acetyltransferase